MLKVCKQNEHYQDNQDNQDTELKSTSETEQWLR